MGARLLRVEDFDYRLPPECVAQTAAEPRDSARLLVLDRASGQLRDHHFCDLPAFLRPGDALVVNDSRVLSARLFGQRAGSGGRVEVLLLRQLAGDKWECLARPGRKVPPGGTLLFGGGRLRARVLARTDAGGRILELASDAAPVPALIAELGQIPLPPYIYVPLANPDRYQTVYARLTGSAAAPTAGLHFTPELLAQIRAQGIRVEFVTLHVGVGTFRPVRAEVVTEHRMHAEWYALSPATAESLNAVRQAGGRIIPIGTTALRTLETICSPDGAFTAQSGWTDIFIYPGHQFRAADALVTNFHLPRSTLLMLVAAFAGREQILNAYAEAIRRGYRFYSFGDAMLIV